MIAVSNTTPLRYLIAIQQEQLLSSIFERVIIPSGVFLELSHPKTPSPVREALTSRPQWLHVHDMSIDAVIPGLHRGEQEAILLAEQVKADVLLMDERSGRTSCTSTRASGFRNIGGSGTR